MRIAVSIASVPLLVKNIFAGRSPGKSFSRVSASSTMGMVGNSVDTCCRVRACFSMAATTLGWQWPRETVTMPPKKSR